MKRVHKIDKAVSQPIFFYSAKKNGSQPFLFFQPFFFRKIAKIFFRHSYRPNKVIGALYTCKWVTLRRLQVDYSTEKSFFRKNKNFFFKPFFFFETKPFFFSNKKNGLKIEIFFSLGIKLESSQELLFMYIGDLWNVLGHLTNSKKNFFSNRFFFSRNSSKKKNGLAQTVFFFRKKC